MKRSKKKPNIWQDHYARKARRDRYPARSIYKLQEIQKKHRIIRKSDRVLDLGCSPGSWLLYAAESTGTTGQVVGVDIKKIDINLPRHVKTIQDDITADKTKIIEKVGKGYHVVLSDMAPATSGNKHVDAARSYFLCQEALSLAKLVLKAKGNFVCKIFQGEDVDQFIGEVRLNFQRCKLFKPKSSRKASKEIFVIGIGKK